MRQFRKIAVPAIAALLLGGGKCDDCQIEARLYEPYVQALVHPERFDAWLEGRRSLFDNSLLQCTAQVAREAQRRVDVLERRCNETFTAGSEYWHMCHDEITDDGLAFMLRPSSRRPADVHDLPTQRSASP